MSGKATYRELVRHSYPRSGCGLQRIHIEAGCPQGNPAARDGWERWVSCHKHPGASASKHVEDFALCFGVCGPEDIPISKWNFRYDLNSCKMRPMYFGGDGEARNPVAGPNTQVT